VKRFFASCPKGIEETLFAESEHYNFSHREITRGGFSFKSEINSALNFLLETRVASRVYQEIGSFIFEREKNLYEAAKEIPWQKIMNHDQTLRISCLISNDIRGVFRNSHHLSLVLKDAIVDTFRDNGGERPSIDTRDGDYHFLLRIEPNGKKGFKGIILLDLAGFPLHQRGYREFGHQAPMKENLAAALVLNTSWDKEIPLSDPFCGSGTLLIEAAMIKYNIPPMYLPLKEAQKGYPYFAFQIHEWFKRDESAQKVFKHLTSELIAKAENGIQKATQACFMGNDTSKDALSMLSKSWKRLGLPQKALRLNMKNAIQVAPEFEGPGVVITNPPYGVRLEEPDEGLKSLYHNFGENLKNNWKGTKAYIVSQDPVLRKSISLRTEKRFVFWNGPLECRLLTYDLF